MDKIYKNKKWHLPRYFSHRLCQPGVRHSDHPASTTTAEGRQLQKCCLLAIDVGSDRSDGCPHWRRRERQGFTASERKWLWKEGEVIRQSEEFLYPRCDRRCQCLHHRSFNSENLCLYWDPLNYIPQSKVQRATCRPTAGSSWKQWHSESLR